jgi:hypothetical protein
MVITPKSGKPVFGHTESELGIVDDDLIAWKLVGPSFYFAEVVVQPAAACSGV